MKPHCMDLAKPFRAEVGAGIPPGRPRLMPVHLAHPDPERLDSYTHYRT